MNTDSNESLKSEIISLANLLDKQFAKEFNFKNHCYLRIAYDNAVNNKWDKAVNRPFIKNASAEQLKMVLAFLQCYSKNKDLLNKHNLLSLAFRKN